MSQRLSKNTFKTRNQIKESNDNCVTKINIFLVGSRKVGKTSLIFRYATNMFSETYFPTIGVDTKVVEVETHDGKRVAVTFWDTPGDDAVRQNSNKELYSRASGFLLLYDVNNVESYNAVYDWMRLIENNALENAQVVVIGNKTDLRDSNNPAITKDDGVHMASCYNAKFMETSVYTKKNINKTIKRMVTNICNEK
ncbi:ras-related protein Rab-3C isoform X1 [Hydra vulgaris]|uniref:ras-related protein Rab-3C isoform X1 n=1 Tax=Hydra vulgaris TaxID=6087 RepID=UPI00064133DB|nr:ras-related protein Rab-3C [Hydra vulgaris]